LRDCCGCIWLALEQDLTGAIPLDGDWEFAIKRSILEPNEIDYRDEIVADPSLHSFEERALASGVSGGQKTIKACEFEWTSEDYPAYPDFFNDPSNQINFDGNFVGVKKYFRNSSTSRTSFDVAQFASYDRIYPWPAFGTQGTAYHQTYETEHVFEGQTISRFFSNWLPFSAATPRQCFWIQSYFGFASPQWGQNANGDYNSFGGLLVDEPGSVDHQDRLAIFLDRPNGHKGRLFRGITPISAGRFGEETAGDAQLTMAREIGMIFAYMNLDPVWESFCDTYNGILTQLEAFDAWYPTHTGVQSSLATEWPLYIRRELDMVVTNARSDLKVLNQYRKPAGALYARRWNTIMAVTGGEIQKVKLERTDICRNLPASRKGPFTG